ncbi:MAG: NAD-dependent epimerase/dehydratase family protein [Bacteroidota bacterium]
MILVTGGTGLVGSHLLYELLKTNESIRAIYRRDKTLSRVKHVFSYYTDDADKLFAKIDWIKADITDIPTLENAFKDVEKVYHCSAFVSFEPNKYNQLRKINIEGTANIVNLCITNKIKKLCYISSIAAIGEASTSKTHISEKTEWNPEKDNSVYAITKYGAEMEVWRGTQEGVDAVIVNPGIIMGPGFWKGGGSGSLIKKVYNGLKYYPLGSSGYVDVWDTVSIMRQLMEGDIKNERFILVAENRSFKEFQDMVAKSLGVKKATKPLKLFKLGILWRLDWLRSNLLGKRRILSKQMANSITTNSKFDTTKVRDELGFVFKDLDFSIMKVCNFYKKDMNDN